MANPVKNLEFEWRFWAKVRIKEGCWEWLASKDGYGYGRTGANKTWTKAHRTAYELLIGAIPEGKFIDHKCYNRGCVNPSHLRVCTNAENMRHRGKTIANTSGYKGVTWDRGRWVAQIMVDYKRKYLGRFVNIEDAKLAYIAASKIFHGDFTFTELGEP